MAPYIFVLRNPSYSDMYVWYVIEQAGRPGSVALELCTRAALAYVNAAKRVSAAI